MSCARLGRDMLWDAGMRSAWAGAAWWHSGAGAAAWQGPLRERDGSGPGETRADADSDGDGDGDGDGETCAEDGGAETG